MNKLNKTTKQAKQFITVYNNSCSYTLQDIYGNYSTAKQKAYNWCRNRMSDLSGNSFRMLSGNSFYFTCGFKAIIDGVNCLIIETAQNEYKIELD